MQEELSSKTLPMYEGRFSSLQTPVPLEYRPVRMRLAGTLGIYKNVRDRMNYSPESFPAGSSIARE